jgi:prepilin-type N-terminal cleavage/methylation domain-containing protein
MSRQRLTAVRSQAGFTLVELAVVMIIIGLLIGGVLKGQELVKNAQITATVAQIKGIDAATSAFRDMYSGIPGDLLNAGTRIAGCTAAASPVCNAAAGTGNGQLSTAPTVAPGTEASAYFVQLALADLLSGIDTAAATTCGSWGLCYPEAKAGSGAGLQIGYFAGGALGTAAAAAPRGHYLTIQTGPQTGQGTTAGAQALTPNQAARIDSKVDDGRPGTGSVVSGGAAACINGTAYAENIASADCNLFLRIQG